MSKDNTNKNIENDKGYLDLQQYKFKTYLSSVSRYIQNRRLKEIEKKYTGE